MLFLVHFTDWPKHIYQHNTGTSVSTCVCTAAQYGGQHGVHLRLTPLRPRPEPLGSPFAAPHTPRSAASLTTHSLIHSLSCSSISWAFRTQAGPKRTVQREAAAVACHSAFSQPALPPIWNRNNTGDWNWDWYWGLVLLLPSHSWVCEWYVRTHLCMHMHPRVHILFAVVYVCMHGEKCWAYGIKYLFNRC